MVPAPCALRTGVWVRSGHTAPGGCRLLNRRGSFTVGAPSASAELPGTEAAAGPGRGAPSGPPFARCRPPAVAGRGEEEAVAAVGMAGEEAVAHAPLAPPRLCCARLSCCILGPRRADAAGAVQVSAVLPGRGEVLGGRARFWRSSVALSCLVLRCPVSLKPVLLSKASFNVQVKGNRPAVLGALCPR